MRRFKLIRGDRYRWWYPLEFGVFALISLFNLIILFPGSSPRTFGIHWPWWSYALAVIFFAYEFHYTYTADRRRKGESDP